MNTKTAMKPLRSSQEIPSPKNLIVFRVCLIGANSETVDLEDSEFVLD